MNHFQSRFQGRLRCLFIMAVWGSTCPGLVAQDEKGSTPQAAKTDSATADYFAAQGLLQKQVYDLAAREFEKFLKSNPKHDLAPMARYGLAICRLQTADYGSAIQELLPLSRQKEFEFAPDVWVMLAQSRLAQKEWKQAATDAQRMLSSFPDHSLADDAGAIVLEALFRQGAMNEVADLAAEFEARWKDGDRHDRILYFQAAALTSVGEWDAAEKPLQELLTLHPDSPLAVQATLLAAQSAEHRGDFTAASKRFRQLTEASDDLLKQHAWLGLARILRQEGKPNEAMAALGEIGSPAEGGDLAAQVSFARGQLYFDEEEFGKAADSFAECVTRDPALAQAAAYWEAKCALRLGDYAKAVEKLNKAIQSHTEGALAAELRYDLAYAFAQLGDDKQAVKVATQLVQDFPDRPLAADATYLSARSLQKLKQYDQSQKHTREFVSRYFEHPLLPQVKFLSAENEYLAGRLSEAAVSYRRFLDEFPRHEQTGWVRQRLGIVLYRLERFDEALGVLALRIDGNEEDIGFRAALPALGDIYFRKGDYAQAIEYLRKYLRLEPQASDADDVLIKLGLAYARSGQHDQAILRFDELLRQFSQSVHRVHAMFEKGQCQLALNQSDSARATFEQVVEIEEQSRFAAPAMNHLGSLASAAGETRRAAEWYSRSAAGNGSDSDRAAADLRALQAVSASNDWVEAERRARALIKRQPASDQAASAEGYLAIALSRQGKSSDALALLSDLTEAEWDAMPDSLRQTCQIEQASCLRQQGRDDDAQKVLERLLSDSPTGNYRSHALLSLAEIESAHGRCDQARLRLEEFNSLLVQDSAPTDSLLRNSQYLSAKCSYELKDFEAAVRTLSELLDSGIVDELQPSTLTLYAESNYQLKKYQQALNALGQLIEQFPEHTAIPVALLRAGECHAELSHWEQSEKAYQTYIERFPRGEFVYRARFGVGWAREHQQKTEEAISAYRTVIAEHQGDTAARAQFQIGECLFALGRLEEAVAEFTKVEVLYSSSEWSPAAAYEAARCLKALNKPAEAKAQFESVASRFAQTQWGRLAAESLSSGT